MDSIAEPSLRSLGMTAERVMTEHLLPHAEQVDVECRWPEAGLRALADAGLMGLTVPAHLGGHGQGLSGLAAITQVLARGCASTAMCYGMHCVATAVIAAKATPAQQDRYLKPIAAGRHVTSLALSEAGSGSFFFLPETRAERDGDEFVLSGAKQFVTNGSHADSYVVSTRASDDAETGEFDCLVVDGALPGIEWQAPWQGFGMRGNSSRGMRLQDVRVAVDRLLGNEGDAPWYVFEVVTPYFLTAMAGVYLGVAQAAYDITAAHLQARRHAHSGETLAQLPSSQLHVADLWIRLRQGRLLLQHAAELGDLGSPDALPALFGCKVAAADAAVGLANEAMTLCGGMAYRDNSTLARLLRDARASHVMAPTSDLLRQWIGRVQLGQPLL
jgi:isovaleryl-CoA dehydrogenase